MTHPAESDGSPPASSSRLLGILLAASASVWAAAFLVPYKHASQVAPAPTVALGLLLMAAIINSAMLGVKRWTSKPLPSGQGAERWRLSKLEVLSAIAIALLAVVGNICSSSALQRMNPSTVSVVLRSEVLVVGLLGILWLGERRNWSFALGALCALGGFAVLRMDTDGGGVSGAGVLLAVGAATSFSGIQILVRKIAARVRLLTINGIRLWICAVILALTPGVAHNALSSGTEFWLASTAAALCGPVASRMLLMLSLRHLEAAETTLLMLLSPLFAATFAYWAFGDVPSATEWWGGAAIVLGVALPLLYAAVAGTRQSRALRT